MDRFTNEYCEEEIKGLKNKIYPLVLEDALEAIITRNDTIANLHEQLDAERPTGICEICTDKSVKKADRLNAENRKLKDTITKQQETIGRLVDALEKSFPKEGEYKIGTLNMAVCKHCLFKKGKGHSVSCRWRKNRELLNEVRGEN